MPAVTFTEAAAAVGHKSRSWLYRARDDGRLDAYLRPGARGGAQLLELTPPGLPPLREWVRQVQASTTPAPAGADDDALAQLVAKLPEDQIPDLGASRARREHYLAERARLEALQLRGELVSTADVKAEAFNLARGVRDRVMNVPARIAPTLAAESTVAGAQRLLTHELQDALRVLGNS